MIFFVALLIRQQKRYRRLQQYMLKAESNSLQRERKRIAHDLHDSVGSMMHLVFKQVEIAGELIPGNDLLNGSLRNLQAITQTLKNITGNLSQDNILPYGLQAGIANLVQQYQPVHIKYIQFIYEVTSELPVQFSVHLYHMVQELLHNTYKHAKASKVSIQFKQQKNRLYIQYTDNGHGIPLQTGLLPAGMGLNSILTRTRLLKGNLQLGTKKGAGYFFSFILPSGHTNYFNT